MCAKRADQERIQKHKCNIRKKEILFKGQWIQAQRTAIGMDISIYQYSLKKMRRNV